MIEAVGESDPPSPLSVASSDQSRSSTCTSFDANRVAELKGWLGSQFDAVGKDVPDFEYTSRSIAHLLNIATVSQAKTQVATIVANDFRQKAAEYRSQAARLREILDHVGLMQDNLPSNVVSPAQVLARVANLLNIRDTELSSYLVAMADLSLRKTEVEEKRAKAQQESKELLDYTRKAIARLTYLKRTKLKQNDEFEEHLFRNCTVIRRAWTLLEDWLRTGNLMPPSLHTYMMGKPSGIDREVWKVPWCSLFWQLWGVRNQAHCQNQVSTPEEIFQRTQIISWRWLKVNSKDATFNFSMGDWMIDPFTCLKGCN